MRVEHSSRISPGELPIQPPVITGFPSRVKDRIDLPAARSNYRSFLQVISKFLNKFKEFILSFFKRNQQEEAPLLPPSPPPSPIPVPVVVEERKKEVFDDLRFIQGYDLSSKQYYHLVRFKGKQLIKIILDQEIHLDHFIHPEDVPCIIVESAADFPKEITREQLQKIKSHLVELICFEESKRIAKVRLVVLNYKSPMINILNNLFAIERKIKKDHKEFTIFKSQ